MIAVLNAANPRAAYYRLRPDDGGGLDSAHAVERGTNFACLTNRGFTFIFS